MLRGIGKTVSRKLAALKGAAEFSAAVRDAVSLLYRRDAPRIRDAVLELPARRARITAANTAGVKVLARDHKLLRAALRREGFDVGELVVG